VTFVDRPFMGFMLQWLARHGVTDVIMCCGFLATKVRDVLGDGSAFGVRLRFVEEPEPRGTAGALKYAEELLDERFLMLNGDVLTDVDVGAQLRRHEQTGAVGTLGLVPVEDPSAYGLVLLDERGAVTGFLEKPGSDQLRDVDHFLISAGIYVLERPVLDLIPPGRAVSIEREVWPRLVGEGLYGYAAEDAYWLDIGTPERYLDGTRDILAGHVETAVSQRLDAERRDLAGDVDAGARVTGPVIVEAGASVAAGARIVGPAVVGQGSRIAEHAVVESAVVLRDCRIGAGAHVRRAILAGGVRIGANTIVEDGVVLGEGVDVGADCVLSRGMKVFPHTTLPDGAIRF
jgi:mannose-1-phosphate guanylyltransferase